MATDAGFARLYHLSRWLRRKTGKYYAAAVRDWRLLEPAFSKEVAEAYRDGMKALWRAVIPERPVRAPGGPTTTKWINIYAYTAVGLEAAETAGFANTLSPEETRRAVLHGCLTEQGYPEWLDEILAVHPGIAAPLVRDAFAQDWAIVEGGVSYFLYRYSPSGAEIHPAVQTALFEIIKTVVPPQLNTLDRGLDIVRNLSLTEERRALLRALAIAQFTVSHLRGPNGRLASRASFSH